MKKLYGIGTGPGDSEYLTLKAARIISEADVIFAPCNKGKNIALNTVSDYIKDKKIILVDMPMSDISYLTYDNAVDIIESNIKDGEIGAFLTIGDPMIYSTFIYIMNRLLKSSVEVEIIPGITSFCAAAALSKFPLTMKGDKLYICDGDIDENELKLCSAICILKTSKNKEGILNVLEKNNFKYVFVKRCGLKGQDVIKNKDEILKDEDYLSLIIGRRELND